MSTWGKEKKMQPFLFNQTYDHPGPLLRKQRERQIRNGEVRKQADVAEAIGTCQEHLSRFENGQENLSIDMLFALMRECILFISSIVEASKVNSKSISEKSIFFGPFVIDSAFERR